MTSPSVHDAAAAYFAAIRDADADAFADLFSADVHFEDPVGGPALSGHDGVRRFHKGLRRAWQALHMEARDVFARGSRAAVRWHAEGTSGTGKAIAFDGVSVIEVDPAGKIRRLEGYWDLEGVIAQM